VVRVEASVLKLGRDVGVIDVQLRQHSTGQLVAMVRAPSV
jgi:acyl-coenzyme A thioesterase PaaI-like protein